MRCLMQRCFGQSPHRIRSEVADVERQVFDEDHSHYADRIFTQFRMELSEEHNRRMKRLWIALTIVMMSGFARDRMLMAQANGPAAPTALILTYRARPGERMAFLEKMRTEGNAQFAQWKKDGVFASYHLLAPAYAAAGKDTPDLYAIVEFAHFTDLVRWQRIEKALPGGLPQDVQSIAWAETSGTADVLKKASASASTSESQYFILTYDVMIPMPAYEKYALGYAVPQFDGWIKAGALNSYEVFINQNAAGAPWSSLILLEYKDIEALGRREMVKDAVRKALAASNPEWKKWSEDKSATRKELAGVPVLELQ